MYQAAPLMQGGLHSASTRGTAPQGPQVKPAARRLLRSPRGPLLGRVMVQAGMHPVLELDCAVGRPAPCLVTRVL